MNTRSRNTGSIAAAALAATICLYSTVGGQYVDLPGFSEKMQGGRTRNAFSVLVAGTAAHEMYPDRSTYIDMTSLKTLYPDSRVTGSTSPSSIDTNMDLLLTSAAFSAKIGDGSQGRMIGTVDKSEFDWDVVQTGSGRYEVQRFGLKFNSGLEIHAKDGKIIGKYVRSGPHFDWDIDGSYNADGGARIHVNVPMGLDIVLEGFIAPQ